MLIVHGKKTVLTPPKEDIDCGNSGRRCALLAACLPDNIESQAVGDAGISRRQWTAYCTIRQMGANILAEGRKRRRTPYPWRLPTWNSLSSAHCRRQVKSALLLRACLPEARPLSRSRHPREIITRCCLTIFSFARPEDDGNVTVFGDQVPESPGLYHSGRYFLGSFLLSLPRHNQGASARARSWPNETRTRFLAFTANGRPGAGPSTMVRST